ncbi:hypothetical protein HU200_029371 [Digitaria exilis]|uniref:Bifunctional inhibitor/plant lipid transfer protein/seed storage helical domain-containing protein n=1 Tax=Digitaria exilis TaxID=1010633 RepID=A0A835EV41_9POAL|nr:hypothetical protein HU200_029371 [Digitaria exilis]
MLLGKVALLLILCAMTFSQQVLGTCTQEQKEAVLNDCQKFIKQGHENPRPIPVMGQTCCNTVNKVPKKGTRIDMQCIVDLLTEDEKTNHNARKILNLPNHCQE